MSNRRNIPVKEVVYTVGPDGSVTSEAFGFEGKECEIASQLLEGLQDEVLEHRDKPEKDRRVRTRTQKRLRTKH